MENGIMFFKEMSHALLNSKRAILNSKRAIFSMVAILMFCTANIVIADNPIKEEDKTIKQKAKVIGILMPMDHAALREIVVGFKETLSSLSESPVEFKVQNSQGDMNVQRSIIQQFVSQNVDVIVPIGTTATQMTAKLAKQQPIVSLAALHKTNNNTTQNNNKKHDNHNREDAKSPPTKNMEQNLSSKTVSKEEAVMMTGVLDEIGPKKPLELLDEVIPNLKKITLVHSSSEKVFPEIEELLQYAKAQNLEIQKLMIQSLADMYTISRLIDEDSQAIFVLKDHLVVSGIRTLVQEAKKKNIPVVTSDEGSVEEGAAFALGVKERMIGEQGARLAYKVLSGIPAQNLPLEVLDKLSVFYNEKACINQGVDIDRLKHMTEKLGYEALSLDSNQLQNDRKQQ